MNELSFFWHDYETFGRVPRRDRPAQFAGVRTDAELNEIGDPLMLYCQPADDVLPDPESCLLTGITPQLCQQRGVPEAQFAQRILSELSRPGTVGVGYNSIRFDDEVTRHLFWRNLIDPYARGSHASYGKASTSQTTPLHSNDWLSSCEKPGLGQREYRPFGQAREHQND